jgi:hypothetical protein
MAVKDHLMYSDVQEVVSSTFIPGQQKQDWHINATESMKVRSALAPMSFVHNLIFRDPLTLITLGESTLHIKLCCTFLRTFL